MRNHTVHSYEKELNSLNKLLIEMAGLARDMLVIASKSISQPGDDFIQIAKRTDRKINELDMQIEQQAIAILALRQPMAIDLRQAVSALKLAVIMERVGDLAKNTAKRTSRVETSINLAWKDEIQKMINIILGMFENVITAFETQDKEVARSVWVKDAEVDAIYSQLMDVIQQEMANTQQGIQSLVQMIFALKNIERIGDYVTKIAKIIFYILSGEKAPSNMKA